jgi:quinol monooxygenase YgiN
MTVSLFQRIQVKDFDSWLNTDPDAVRQMMKEQGVVAFSLHRNLDDRNSLNIHYQFADENSAKSFVTWMEKMITEWPKIQAGGEQEILESWIGEDIPSHSST